MALLLRVGALDGGVGRIEDVTDLVDIVTFRSVWSTTRREYGRRFKRSLCSQRRHMLGMLDIAAKVCIAECGF